VKTKFTGKKSGITDNFNLTIQGPTKETQTSQTQIDLLFTNIPDRITMSINLLTGISDHNATLWLESSLYQCATV
jgi:hypothetical protein